MTSIEQLIDEQINQALQSHQQNQTWSYQNAWSDIAPTLGSSQSPITGVTAPPVFQTATEIVMGYFADSVNFTDSMYAVGHHIYLFGENFVKLAPGVWEFKLLSPTQPVSPSVSPDSPDAYASPAWYVNQKYPKEDKMDQELFYNKEISKIISLKNGRQTGLIGLEIECEGKNLFNTPFQYWTCHTDGSLRETDGHPPVEYVLRQPLNLEECREALRYLDEKLKETGSHIVNSPRSSVHVHVNCQKMTLRQVYCYILLYIIFEEILIDWAGPERAGNLFCLRAKDSEFYIQMLESGLKQNNLKLWREDYRYSACNVASICKFGSLEFRALRGTVDINLIQQWVELLLMLRDASLKYDNPVEIVEEFIRIGPLPFFKKIFKEPHRKVFEDTPGLSGKLWDGLRLMRDVAYCCEWVPPLKKSQDSGQDKVPESQSEDVNPQGGFIRPGTRCDEYVWLEDSDGNGDEYIVKGTYSGAYPKTLYCTYEFEGQTYSYFLPTYHTAYYVPDERGYFLLLDVRPGMKEYDGSENDLSEEEDLN